MSSNTEHLPWTRHDGEWARFERRTVSGKRRGGSPTAVWINRPARGLSAGTLRLVLLCGLLAALCFVA